MLLALNVEIQYEIATGYVYGPVSTTVISCVLLNDTLNRCLEQLQYWYIIRCKQTRNRSLWYFVAFQQQLDSLFKRQVVSNVPDPSHGVLCGLGNRIGLVSDFILNVLFWMTQCFIQKALTSGVGGKASNNKGSQIPVQVDLTAAHIMLTFQSRLWHPRISC